MTDNSPMTELAERARAVMPAGGFGNFEPGFFVKSGAGSRVIDENGKEYVDYMISSGPMILGHGHEEVNAAVREQLDIGMTFFANNAAGLELAEAICDAVPCAERCVMSAPAARRTCTPCGLPARIRAGRRS